MRKFAHYDFINRPFYTKITKMTRNSVKLGEKKFNFALTIYAAFFYHVCSEFYADFNGISILNKKLFKKCTFFGVKKSD